MLDGKIRNLIFDLGGVILNLDTERTVTHLASLAGMPSDAMRNIFAQENFFLEFEKGSLTASQFRMALSGYMPSTVSITDLDNAWNAMLLDIPPVRLQKLESLKGRYRTFLLSNTNEIHLNFFNGIVRSTSGEDNLNPYFEKVYFSHTLGMRKPDPRIFNHVLTANQLTADETVFFDDNLQNVEAARTTGIQPFLVKNPDHLFNQLP